MTYPTIALVFALAASVGCASKKQHENMYCSALTALNDDVTKLSKIGPNSRIDDLRLVVHSLERDTKTAEHHGRKIGTATAKQLTQSVNQLSVDAQTLTGNMTIAQAQARIDDDVQNVMRDAKALASESHCPEAMPHAVTGRGATPPHPSTPPG